MRLNKTRARKNTEEWTIIMASDFWLIAGLGNPGSKYEGTRHNMGFMTADVLAERWSVNFSDHKGLAMLGKGVMNLSGRNVKFFLAKPLTYMNESGNAVASISAYYQIEPDHIRLSTTTWTSTSAESKSKPAAPQAGTTASNPSIVRSAPRNTRACAWASATPNAEPTRTTTP